MMKKLLTFVLSITAFISCVNSPIAMSGCVTTQASITTDVPVEQLIAAERSAILRLEVAHLVFVMPNDVSSCTAFHIGHGKFVTAAHCIRNQREVTSMLFEDQNGTKFVPTLLNADFDRDLAILYVKNYDGKKLELWNTKHDGDIPLGMEIVGLGFPGYLWTSFSFETGYYKGQLVEDSIKYMLSKDLTYRGYSGGPIVSRKNGKVIGISHVIFDRITVFDDGHQHAWISQAVSVSELEDMLQE